MAGENTPAFAGGKIINVQLALETTDGTQTAMKKGTGTTSTTLYTPQNGEVVLIEVTGGALQSENTITGGSVIHAIFKRVSGTTTQVSTTSKTVKKFSDGALDLDFGVSSPNITLLATGKSSTRLQWWASAVIRVLTPPNYDVSTAYVIGDMVSAYGSIYRAHGAVDAGTAPPSAPWSIVAQGTSSPQLS